MGTKGSAPAVKLKKPTAKGRQPSVYDRFCPAHVVIDHLADKWAVLIIGRLANGTMRFAELRRAVDGISQKMLTVTLRDLERDGLVSRKLYASVPPKVEYSLTPFGQSLRPILFLLREWGDEYRETLAKNK